MTRTLLTAAAVMALALPAQAEEVRVGFMGPLSGPAAAYGQDLLNGVELAVKEINEAGGISGRELVLEKGDDRGSPKDAANVAQGYVSDDDVVAMIGGATSTATFGAVPVAQRGKLPFIITLASHPDLTREGDYIFRNSTTQELEGPALGRLVEECLAAESVGIIHLNNDWALAMTSHFKEAMEERGIQVIAEEDYNAGENVDYTAKLSRLTAADPDIYWFGSQYNDLALLLKQANRMGMGDKPRVGSAGVHSTGLIDVAGENAENFYLHTLFYQESEDPTVKRFVDNFRTTYDQDPNLFSSQSYDAMHILAKAIEQGGYTREGTRDALLSLEPHDGVGGSISFDPETREAVGKSFIPLVVRDGRFTLWQECADKLAQR